MAKKFIAMIMIFMFSIFGSYMVIHASDPRPVDNLDNRYEVENTAGITWDQINEMSNNSPNSLTPIQGLVLWMFAIIAFLKLAQKMDNLLQSLGLNVTQTGGRAVGDMIMAGMALKHVGNVMSRGMSMFGGGRGGGTPAPGGGTGTGRTGGTGPTPIPAGSPGSGPTPVGGSPGGARTGGSPTPSGSGTGTPGGGSPSGGSPTTPTAPSPGATPPRGSSGSSTATSSSSSGSATSSSGATSSSRNPVGRAVNWMRQNGVVQGAIKAGAKGGAIGLGVYGTKVGASRIGGAISSRLGINGSSANPTENVAANNNSASPIGQPPADINNQGNAEAENASRGENLGEYQDSRPLDGTGDNPPIPATINNEEYQDTSSATSDESSRVPASFNNEEYNDADSLNTAVDTGPIPTSINGGEAQDSDTDSDSVDESSSGSSAYITDSGGTWHNSKPVDASKGAVPIPSAKNNESWSETTPSSGVSSSAANADGVTPTTVPQTAVPSPATASIPAIPTQAGQAEGVTPSSAAQQGTSVTTVASDIQANTSVQIGAVTQNGSTTPGSNADSAVRQEVSAGSVSSVISSESVSVTKESSSSHESVTHDSSSGYSDASSSDVDSGSGEVYESRQMPINNQSISTDLPQSAAASTTPPISSQDISAIENPSVNSTTITQMAAQSDFNGINTNSLAAQPEVIPPTQVHTSALPVNEPTSVSQQNTTVQAQATNVTSVTDAGTKNPGQITAQSSVQVVHSETPAHSGHRANTPPKRETGSNRPTSTAKQKNSSVKARKRKR